MSTDSKMNFANLNLIHPDDIEHPTTPVSNMPFDESMEFRNSDYMSSEAMEISDEMEECQRLEREDIDVYDEVFNNLPPIPPSKEEEQEIVDEIEEKTYNGKYYAEAMEMEAAMRQDATKIKRFHINLGDGKFYYIKNLNDREMLTNAWQAITQTNNWNFMGQEIESFMLSNNPKIYEISRKMEELGYNGHSGCSFGCTMRNMQYLAEKGEEEFKKLFQLDELECSI